MEVALWIDTPALGDTIAAIPALRKLSQAYGNQPVTVFTTKPFLFEGHPLVKEALKSDADKSNYKVYRTFSPLVGKGYDLMGDRVEFRYSNMDLRQFHAVSLGFTLTEAEMDMDLYIEKARELPVKDYVIIHPTHTWPTRTWEQEKWQELVNRLNDRGIPVVAVGRDAKEVGFFNTDKPVMPINIKLGVNLLNDPDNDPAELRWMMNHRARAVVTMDSGILHIAGTTDTHIIQLGSSIDNKLRAPYRNGSQDYKYQFVRGGCGEFCSSNMKYNIKVHGSIQGVPPQVKCLDDRPTFECHPTVDQVYDAVEILYGDINHKTSESKYDRVFITHCDEGYASIANKMIETVKQFSNIPVIAYVINSDIQIPAADQTIRLDFNIREGDQFIESDGSIYVNRASQKVFDIITKKPNVIKHALENFANHVVYLDGDSIATHRIDDLFDYTNALHPMMTQAGEEFMMFNGKGSPFVHAPGEEEIRDLGLTLEAPACELFGVNIENRRFYQAYVQTGYISAIKSNIEFINEWIEMCNHPEVFNNIVYYAPFHEETLVNVLLWKYNYRDRMPLVYVNANSIERIYEAYNIDFNGEDVMRHGPWFFTPGKMEDIKVFHGEKRPDVVDAMVEELKKLQPLQQKPENKKRLVYLAPHLSTGGMPEFLLARVKAMLDDSTFEIHVIEYCMYADTYVVQRDQIKNLLGNRFHDIAHLGDIDQETRENQLKLYLRILQPDIIHIEESPESFDSFNQMTYDTQEWLYATHRPWKIVETCHNIWFDPRGGKRISPDAYALVSPHHRIETFSQEDSLKQEIHFPIIEQSVSEEDRRKLKEFLGFNPDADQYHLINIGLWTPGKNQGEAIEWARNLETAQPGRFQFHFIGNQASNFAHYWEPLMKDLPANCHVWGERSDVETFYGIADAVVFNSTWECNPLTIRQSLGWPLPVVARNLPQYHDLYTGLLTEITGDVPQDLLQLQRVLETKRPEPVKDSMKRFKQEHLELYLNTLQTPTKRKSHITDWTLQWDGGPKVTSHVGREIQVDFQCDGKSVYNVTIQGEGHWARPAAEYWKDWTVFIDGEPHRLENSVQIVQFDSSSLGDTLSWVEPVVRFKEARGLEKVYIATHKNWLFDLKHYEALGIHFIAPGEWPSDAEARWKVGVYMEDPGGEVWFPNRNPRDWRKIYLGDIASDILGIETVERAPKLTYKGKTMQQRPYICIATASTAQAKYWNNPTGWQDLVDHYRGKGYDIYHISKESTDLRGVKKAPEDLKDVYRLLQGAELFFGISSGLSWFAWCTDVPVVLISGFTPEECEFNNERTIRIINKSVCNGCWAREHFNRGDWNWCPDHKGTDRMFECTKTISAADVIEQVNTTLQKWNQETIKVEA